LWIHVSTDDSIEPRVGEQEALLSYLQEDGGYERHCGCDV
jgi:hypothetical protein